MKIALAQINTTVGDFSGNSARIVEFSRRAAEMGAALAVFPELSLCGYPPRDLVERPDFVARCEVELMRLARALPSMPVLVGTVRPSGAAEGKLVTDSAVLLKGGEVVRDYAKALLPFYDVFDESRYFEPGRRAVVCDLDGEHLGLTVCEDVWNDKTFWKKRLYDRDPVEETMRAGATILLNIAASPFTLGKMRLREEMLGAIARDRRTPVVYVNLVGGNDSLVFDGSSCGFDSTGRLAVRAKLFEEDLIIFDTRAQTGTPAQCHGDGAESVYHALVLGVRDYVSKCDFRSTIVGLSGGIDSSVVAAIAVSALGPQNVYGVSLPGPFSSAGSLADAETLARNLGIHYRVIPITPLYEAYLRSLAPVFENRAHDATEENIQARIRGNILMALSNKFGALVLSTGNKSELAVGYCTLYGDMAGGLAVIGDVPKTMVYDLARLVNRRAGHGGPIPAASLEKAPSAELRPGQTDQDSLPPYEILDPILRACIEENLSASAISTQYGFDAELVRSIVRRVAAAEYKRQQAAPALKVTGKAFGIGRRFPVASKYSE